MGRNNASCRVLTCPGCSGLFFGFGRILKNISECGLLIGGTECPLFALIQVLGEFSSDISVRLKVNNLNAKTPFQRCYAWSSRRLVQRSINRISL